MARQEGRQEVLLDLMDARFPQAPASLREKLAAVFDRAKIQQIIETIVTASSLAELEHALDPAGK
ncbi:MAG TPA: hypothetical protein VFJ58_13055 [Armatimonadota bacterium]|nr:hypothetical protein [Armatimonadota bacterium]